MTIWCRVRDLSTRHHYDVALSALDALEAEGAVEEIPGRRIRSHHPRRAKHFRPLGRKPITMPRPDGRLTHQGSRQ